MAKGPSKDSPVYELLQQPQMEQQRRYVYNGLHTVPFVELMAIADLLVTGHMELLQNWNILFR